METQENGAARAGCGIGVVRAVAGFVDGFMSPPPTIVAVAGVVVIGATPVNLLID